MPEITRAVGAARAFIVPFGLGRPFGAPRDEALQTRVLRALLELCGRAEAPVVEALSPERGDV